jgi:hypothetical protein
MKSMIVALAAGAAMASSAFGAGTIIAGNSQYDTFAFGATTKWNTSQTGGDGNLRLTGASGTDHLSKNAWYYRTAQSNQNRVFQNGLVPSTNVTEGITGGQHFQNYTDASDNGIDKFSAQFRTNIYSFGANTAVVYTTLTIKNNAATSRTLQIFNLVDFDLNGLATGDTVSYDATQQANKFTDTGITAWHKGFNATGREANTSSALRNTRLNLGSANLNGASGPTTGDVASAFQWSITLAAGESTTIAAAFSLNTFAVPAPGSLALMGLGALVAGRRRR